MKITDEEYRAIQERTSKALQTQPLIHSATYHQGILTFALFGGSVPEGATVLVPARSLKMLDNATEGQIENMSITATGNAIHWDELDEQVSTIALLEIITGLPYAKYDAVKTGAMGGAAKTALKAAATRANGAKGGRPRKTQT